MRIFRKSFNPANPSKYGEDVLIAARDSINHMLNMLDNDAEVDEIADSDEKLAAEGQSA